MLIMITYAAKGIHIMKVSPTIKRAMIVKRQEIRMEVLMNFFISPRRKKKRKRTKKLFMNDGKDINEVVMVVADLLNAAMLNPAVNILSG